MTGKDLLTHFYNHYKNEYALSVVFVTTDEEERSIKRDSSAAVIKRLYTLAYITPIEYAKLLKLLHSPDQENWVIVESIIETININDIQERDEQIQI